MKAQAALVEAFVSVTVVTLGFGCIAALDYSWSGNYAGANPSYSDVFYDMQAALSMNRTAETCAYVGASGCMGRMLSGFAHDYGLGYVEMSVGNSSSSVGDKGLCTRLATECIVTQYGSNTYQPCITVCGG